MSKPKPRQRNEAGRFVPVKNHTKILTLDIETGPHLAHVWSLWNENVPLSRLVESGQMLCFAAKWYGKREVMFWSEHEHGHQVMVEAAHDLLDQADIVVTYNGQAFDNKHLRREILLAGLNPPSPFKDIDLYRVVRRWFKFPSNKLDHVAQRLGLGAKTHHTGFQLWLDCLAGDEKAWALMKRYNKQDVSLTERLYVKLLPWIANHPHVAELPIDDPNAATCNKCGSSDLRRAGSYLAQQIRYLRFQCNNCGGWVRSTRLARVANVHGVG